MIAAIRLRGIVKARKEIESTLKMLRLNRKMHCILLNDNASMKGMIQAVKDYITWGEIDEATLELLIKKRGRKTGDVKLNEKEAHEELAEIKKTGKTKNIKPVFRLTPPSKGFRKSIKQHYPDGELGYRGEHINELLKRMI